MMLEQSKTARTHKDIYTADSIFEVVPRAGHIPRKMTRVGFSNNKPFKKVFNFLFIVINLL